MYMLPKLQLLFIVSAIKNEVHSQFSDYAGFYIVLYCLGFYNSPASLFWSQALVGFYYTAFQTANWKHIDIEYIYACVCVILMFLESCSCLGENSAEQQT